MEAAFSFETFITVSNRGLVEQNRKWRVFNYLQIFFYYIHFEA
jgi:hypothetical protein